MTTTDPRGTHTPGPWEAYDDQLNGYEGQWQVNDAEQREIVATGIESQANALLIAAAPMMAETLAYLDEVLGGESEQTFERELIRIRAAIDTATGGQGATDQEGGG